MGVVGRGREEGDSWLRGVVRGGWQRDVGRGGCRAWRGEGCCFTPRPRLLSSPAFVLWPAASTFSENQRPISPFSSLSIVLIFESKNAKKKTAVII